MPPSNDKLYDLLLDMTGTVSKLVEQVQALAENFKSLQDRIINHEEAHALLVTQKEFDRLEEGMKELKERFEKYVETQAKLNEKTNLRFIGIENKPAQQALEGQKDSLKTVKTVVLTAGATGALGLLWTWLQGLLTKGGN